MKHTSFWFFIAFIFLSLGCSPKTGTIAKVPMEPTQPGEPGKFDDMSKTEDETITLPDLVIEPGTSLNPDTLPVYRPSATHLVDVEDVKIDIRFDWVKKHALGLATLQLKPWFYAIDKVELDAKNFDIHSVKVNKQVAKYDYNNEKLTIFLGKSYERSQKFEVIVDYTAKPDERETFGGSAAITEDKGLYFINPDGAEPNKPKQIWTQGETESNSRWFPIVDKPNERCTQEMFITVDDVYETLSNGKMVDSKKNADGTRTDHYKMDKAHAPYLFMMAIGDFAVVKDKWRGIDLEYYVEKDYEKDARAIFRHTDEMLSFFSDKLNYTYPWSKYSQIIVRDYVSGAMENTTAVVFGDFVQLTERELLDHHYDNEKIIAHEMFHHWFGDLVTCESWSNLTLNEGFANYSEYLWLEHKYGQDVADYHLVQEHQGYISSTGGVGRTLIDFDYGDREEMFDAISYNKGGSILHMLRKYVGDEAFWAGLNRYLTKNEYTAVETDELRMAFEDVTGEDLNWFFNQWYSGAGMPVLAIDYNWNVATKSMEMTIEQSQEGTDVPRVFDVPAQVDIYAADGTVRREAIRLSQRKQTFSFACAEQPKFVNFDAEKSLICSKTDNHSLDEWKFILERGPRFLDRWEAVNTLYDEMGENQNLQLALLNDKAYPIRQLAAESADLTDGAILIKMLELAENDPSPEVQSTALSAIAEAGVEGQSALYEKNIKSDKPYSVVGASLNALSTAAPEKALQAAKSLENEKNGDIAMSIAHLYANNPTADNAAYFAEKAKNVDYMAAFGFFDGYAKYLDGISDPTIKTAALSNFRTWGMDMSQSEWRRFAATKAIADLRNSAKAAGDAAQAAELDKWFKEIAAKETSPILKQYYGMF